MKFAVHTNRGVFILETKTPDEARSAIYKSIQVSLSTK